MMHQKTKQLPKGWKREKLGNDKFKILGSGIKEFNGQKDYLSTSSIKEGKIVNVECKIKYKSRPSRANMQPVNNSSWFAKMKDTVKVYCFDESNFEELERYILSTGFAGILLKDCQPKYFKYFLLSLAFNNQKDKFSTGTTQVAINQEGIKKIEVPYPESLQLQYQIVSAIETQFTRLDDAVKSLKTVKKKIETYRKAVLKKSFEKKEGWGEKRIGDICKLINGRAFKPSEWVGKGLPIIRIQNLNNELAKFNYCNFEVDERFYVDDGNLLFAWSGTPGTSFGAHIWKRGRAVLNQHIFKVEVNKKEINKLFFMYLLNKNIQEYVQKAHGTAGLAHITKGKFEEAKISLPTFSEQKQIVSLIESKFSVIDKVEEIVGNSLKKAEMLRKSILKSAFEGRLVKEIAE